MLYQLENKLYYSHIKALIDSRNCKSEEGLAILEVVNLFAGKWRMLILAPLFVNVKGMRFTEIQQLIPNITPRMLSKELKDLEMSGIVKRTVYDDTAVLIQYGITDSAKELEPIIIQLFEWAKRHRKKSLAKEKVVLR
jgi:DNA-binding HxlR family transcriptional regulator